MSTINPFAESETNQSEIDSFGSFAIWLDFRNLDVQDLMQIALASFRCEPGCDRQRKHAKSTQTNVRPDGERSAVNPGTSSTLIMQSVSRSRSHWLPCAHSYRLRKTLSDVQVLFESTVCLFRRRSRSVLFCVFVCVPGFLNWVFPSAQSVLFPMTAPLQTRSVSFSVCASARVLRNVV